MLWSVDDENLLRKKVRGWYKQQPRLERKRISSSAQAPSYFKEKIKHWFHRAWLSFVPGFILFRFLSDRSHLGTWSDTLLFWPLVCASCLTLLVAGRGTNILEMGLSLYLPISIERMVKAGMRCELKEILYGLWVSWVVLFAFVWRAGSITEAIIFSSWGVFSSFIVLLCLLRINRFKVTAGVGLFGIIFVLGSITEIILLGEGLFFEVLRSSNIGEWILSAITETQNSGALIKVGWGVLYLLAIYWGVGWFKEERRRIFEIALKLPAQVEDFLEIENDLVEQELQERVEPLSEVQQNYDPQEDFLHMCSDESISEWKDYKFLWLVTCVCTVFCWLPWGWAILLGFVVHALTLLACTPFFGGSWSGNSSLQINQLLEHPISLYPVDLKVINRSIQYENIKGCLFALPCWIGCAISIARLTGFMIGFQMLAGIWITLLAWIPFAGFLSLTQSRVVCIRGRIWRKTVTFMAIFLWIIFIGVCLFTCCALAYEQNWYTAWLGFLIFGVWGYGVLLKIWLMSEYLGPSFDHAKDLNRGFS